jgi:twinkle protein
MASPYPVEGVFAVSDFEEERREIYRHGYPNGAKTGWSDLDAYYALYPGQLTVCTGVPNSGKSPFMDNLMMNLAENEGWRHAVFSPENGAISNHIIRLIRQRARKNFFPGYNGRCTSEDVDGALSFIMEHFYFVNPDNESYRIDKILDGFEYLVVKHGVRLVLIDPWNTLEHQKPKDESETNYVGRTLNKFKYFARDMGVHFVLVAHPRTPEKYHMNYIPNMYSISGSANWYNIPDVGIIVHRHMSDDKKTTEYNQIIIEKMKFDWVGARGSVKLDFDVASQRFKELERNIFGYHQEPF